MSVSKKHLERLADGPVSSTPSNPSTTSSFSSSVRIFVNNVLTEVLIDTGASISLIQLELLDRLIHDPIRPCSLTDAHTANSGFLSLLGIVQLQIQINHLITYADVYVTSDLICPMILGRDWIQNNYATINFSNNRLSLYHGMTFTPLLPAIVDSSCILSLATPVIIPPFHQIFIYGYTSIPSLDNTVFTPNIALQHNRMIMLPHTVTHIRNHRGIISIINNTRHSKSLAPHTPLGYISSMGVSPVINCISSPVATVSVPSSDVSSSSCCHCSLFFSDDITLYDHLRLCCNKLECTTSSIIHSLLTHISDDTQYRQVFLLLHRYRSLFDTSCSQGINCSPQHVINTGVEPPIAVHPRRISHANRQIIQTEVQKLLDNHIIEPSNSPWSSPVVIIKKSDGSPRFCVDYRRLNSITQKDIYPLPRVDDIIDRLGGSHIFSKLDLRSGFFQVPLALDEREKTAFSTPDGHWQFTRLPQGLKNSPSVFQRLMNSTLGLLRWDICLSYIDDIIVYSPSFHQHLNDLSRVCQVLHGGNFKLNSSKCSVFQDAVCFLGHKISGDGCSPTPDNIYSILNFPVPQSSKAAHSFLQMVGFYRKFIPRFSTISHPLNKFTRKDFPFLWTSIEQESFDQLKAAITSPPVLALPDPIQPYIIRTDASHVGIGAVLLQEYPLGASHPHEFAYKPIAFASRTLQSAEKKYSTIELEALAIWWSVTDKFHSYIDGQQFFLETDHKPLLSLMKKPYNNARIERWMTSLQQYDMIIRHIPGKDNTTADTLSRYPVDQSYPSNQCVSSIDIRAIPPDLPHVNAVTTRSMARRLLQPSSISPTTMCTSSHTIGSPPTPTDSSSMPSSSTHNSSSIPLFNLDLLRSHQTSDPIIHRITTSIPLDPHYILQNHNVLYRLVRRRNGPSLLLPYIPSSLVPSILALYHNSSFNGAHFGIQRTFYKLRDRYYWPNMFRDIERHIMSCIMCRKNKPSRRKPDGHLHSIIPPSVVWTRLAMDYIGPVPTSTDGNKYILVLTDLFSKYVVSKAVPDNTAMTAANFLLNDVFLIYGVPTEIITDNGSHFCSSLYETLLKLTRCCHVKTTPYNPQANGQCERHNATLVPNLMALSNDSRSDWDKKLTATTFNYNATRHASTGYSPFELMFARSPRFLADISSSSSSLIYPTAPQYRQLISTFIDRLHRATRHRLLQQQDTTATRFNKHRLNPQYAIHQRVLIRNRNPHMNKFSPKFIGPFVILQRTHAKTYVVQHPTTHQQLRVPVHDLRSID